MKRKLIFFSGKLKIKKIFFFLQQNQITMISLAKYFSSVIEQGKRILKVTQFGTKTAKECAPFGFDSQPPQGMTAIYAETSNADESVIIGYINKNQLVGVGESRMYSVDGSGAVVAYVLCDSAGRISLNGNAYSSVRFENLQNALNSQNTLINAELSKIATSIGLLGGSYIVAPVTIDISSSQSSDVKLK